MRNCIELTRGCFKARFLLLALMLWTTSMSHAQSFVGNVCGPLIRRYEAAHGIPPKLLTAMSLVESGRKVRGEVIPWPWTINANGKPYVFSTKKEAIIMVRRLRQIGITSIDVGCMQVNLKQHPGAFPTLDAAFDPATNIAYAAKFLKAKKEKKGSWGSAVAHYHSSTTTVHLPYKAKVLKTWSKVQKGQMVFPEPQVNHNTHVESLFSNLESHQATIVKTVFTPSGRRVPMIVKFAPFRGFQKDSLKNPQIKALKKKKDTGPKIIQGWLIKKKSKVVVNK